MARPHFTKEDQKISNHVRFIDRARIAYLPRDSHPVDEVDELDMINKLRDIRERRNVDIMWFSGIIDSNINIIFKQDAPSRAARKIAQMELRKAWPDVVLVEKEESE